MQYIGDYHIHTKWSDGKSTIEECIESATTKGLKEIAITEHGLRNVAYSRKKFLDEYAYIEKLKSTAPIKLLFGNEIDLIDENGNLDMSDDGLQLLDVVMVGFHQFAIPLSFRDWRRTYLPAQLSPIFKSNVSIRKRNTLSVIKCIEKHKVNVLSHPNHRFFIDAKEVAKACADNNTLIEINVKHMDVAEEIIEEVLSTEVKFILNSDAHSATEIGEFAKADEFIKKYGLQDRVVNLVDNR